MAKYPFRNLVFQGGGVKAYAYLGALRELEDAGILPQIERVAGTSAGALLGALVAMRLSVDEIQQVYQTIDQRQMPLGLAANVVDRQASATALERELGRLQDSFSSLRRLVTRFGLHSLEYGLAWMQETFARYCGNGRCTFAQFRDLGFRDLHIVTTNISQHAIEVFCADATPDVAVVDALLISQTIPLYFEALRFDGRHFGRGSHYADGGILLNYPIEVFDNPRYAVNNRWFVNGVNWETLGCRLYTPADCPKNTQPITNVVAYIQHLFEAMVAAQEVAFESDLADQRRTINISNCCVRSTDFSVQPTPENAQFRKLVGSGRAAAQAYLGEYRTPVIKSAFRGLLELLRGLVGPNQAAQ